MIRKLSTSLAALAVLGLITGSIPAASAKSTSKPTLKSPFGVLIAHPGPALPQVSDITTGETLTVFEKINQSEFLDLGKKGLSLGDQLIASGPIMNQSRTKQIGHWNSTAQLTHLTGNYAASYAMERVSASFDGRGEILTDGFFPITGAPDIDAILGGTKQFQNVRGEVHWGQSTNAGAFKTYHLTP